MLARVGIKTEVQTMPAAVLFSRGSKLEFSLFLVGLGRYRRRVLTVGNAVGDL